MATRADSDAETNVGGHQLGCCRRCGALVADTAIHKTLYATAAATGHEAEPIKSRLVQRPIAGVARLLGRQETTLGVCEQPSLAGPLIALWIQAVPGSAMLKHACALP
jgi:hypothetical protein